MLTQGLERQRLLGAFLIAPEEIMTTATSLKDESPPASLVDSALSALRGFFTTKTKHRPSQAMYDALEDIVGTLADMAEGRAEPRIFLSSLDPGVGKTSAICAFVNALREHEGYNDVGVIICLSRLEEIEGLAGRMELPKEAFAALTSDEAINALGGRNADDAQVLFTTQQRLEKHLNGAPFGECEEFFYRGRPRAVRIWDESWLPGQGITLNRDDLIALLKPLRPAYPRLTRELDDLFTSLRGVPGGTRYQLPGFAESHGVDLNEVLSLLEPERDNGERTLRDEQRSCVSAFWFLSGKTVTVHQDGKYGSTVLDYRETLPVDLAPILVTDASGRTRETYTEMERGRQCIQRLRPAVKRYDGLKVHVWRRGGGKESFKLHGQELVDGIASTINTKPEEEWLVVVHKPSYRVGDLDTRIKELVQGDLSRVHFVTWGNHSATNAYTTVSNVILAGTLFYRPSYYEALGRLSAGLSSASGSYPEEDRKRIILGEHRHGILQALCRGSVRLSDGDQCHPCDAYIIASAQSGIPGALPDIFPECRVQRWSPVKRALKGKVKEAVNYLESRLTSDPHGFVSFVEVRKAIGVSSSGNFKNDVRGHEDFKAAIAELGIKETGRSKLFTGFVRHESASAWLPEDEDRDVMNSCYRTTNKVS